MTRLTRRTREREGPILVLDDDPHLREALAELLTQEGHRVLQASDGESARAMTLAHAPSLVVLERLAGRRGAAAVRALQRAVHDAPPTLLLTAPDAPLAGVDGAFELAKPFNVRELLAAVERHRRRAPGDAS